MKFTHYGLSLLAALLLISTKPAVASLVYQVGQSQAQGITGSATVTVWNGSGTNIDFTPTGETIQRVWLDDPSFVTIDFDGNLCSHNSGSCGEGSGASIIHLRRVNGIRFPNLPQTNSTLLTVITSSAAGKKTYLFQVHYGTGAPQYASLVVTPDAQTVLGGGGVVITGGRTANWDDVDRGLQQAMTQKQLAADSPVVVRVQDFLASVRNGVTLEQAIQDSGVTMAVVTHLAELGYRTAPVLPLTQTSSASTAPLVQPPAP